MSVASSAGETLVTWESTFDPDGATSEEAADVITGVYDVGLESLRERFAN